MKANKIFFGLLLSVLVLGIFSCKKEKSLRELRREERQAINNFIKENNIEIINEFPLDTIFADNQYFLDDSTGLYIHIIEKGTGGTPQDGDVIVMNYYEMTMSGDTIQRYWSAADYAHDAPYFIYNVDYTNAGFNAAVRFLQNNGQADLIIPSEIGFSDAQLSVTPYRYKIKIKIKG